VSGAEFANRPGFVRLMNALKPRPPFQALIMSEESRLGREQIEVAYALKQLAQAGVRVWLYPEDRERTLDSPTDKMLMSVTAFADELEREKARQRTYDALLRKARAARVTGGVVFGYNNREVLSEILEADGRRRRLHVERGVNDAEAAVVRRIFQLAAAGVGTRRIAIMLNDEGAQAPVPRRAGRPRSWAPSTVHEILHRPLYRGLVVWGQRRKRDQWGRKKYLLRPERDWVQVDVPALRIVPEELWRAAHARLEVSRQVYLRRTGGQRHGRPASGVDSPYLLSGLATCSCCGGGMIVRSRDFHNHRRYAYTCGYFHARGRSVCQNSLEAPMSDANHTVLETIRQDLLRRDVLEATMRKAVALLSPSPADADRRREALRRRLAEMTQELERLAVAIARGGEIPELLSAIAERQQQRQVIQDELARLDTFQRVNWADVKRAQQDVRVRLAGWRGLLHRQPDEARGILRELLVGRLAFTPRVDATGRWYEITGQGSLGRLLTGVVSPSAVVTPAGFEPAISTLKGSRPGPG
jgi:site-specific DNA recombinase